MLPVLWQQHQKCLVLPPVPQASDFFWLQRWSSRSRRLTPCSPCATERSVGTIHQGTTVANGGCNRPSGATPAPQGNDLACTWLRQWQMLPFLLLRGW